MTANAEKSQLPPVRDRRASVSMDSKLSVDTFVFESRRIFCYEFDEKLLLRAQSLVGVHNCIFIVIPVSQKHTILIIIYCLSNGHRGINQLYGTLH